MLLTKELIEKALDDGELEISDPFWWGEVQPMLEAIAKAQLKEDLDGLEEFRQGAFIIIDNRNRVINNGNRKGKYHRNVKKSS